MLEKCFDELAKKGILKKTKYVYFVDNAGCNIYKSNVKGGKKLVLDSLLEKGFKTDYSITDKVTVIFFNDYFVGAIQ